MSANDAYYGHDYSCGVFSGALCSCEKERPASVEPREVRSPEEQLRISRIYKEIADKNLREAEKASVEPRVSDAEAHIYPSGYGQPAFVEGLIADVLYDILAEVARLEAEGHRWVVTEHTAIENRIHQAAFAIIDTLRLKAGGAS